MVLALVNLTPIVLSDSELVLSPSGIATVCPEATLEIICSTSTDRHFLNWNVTTPPSASESGQAVSRNRLISSNSQSVSPLIINTNVFIYRNLTN